MLIESGGVEMDTENCSTAYPPFLEPGLIGTNPTLFFYLLNTGRQSNIFLVKNCMQI